MLPDIIQHTEKRCWILRDTIVRPSSEQVVVKCVSTTRSLMYSGQGMVYMRSGTTQHVKYTPYLRGDFNSSDFKVNKMANFSGLQGIGTKSQNFSGNAWIVLFTLPLHASRGTIKNDTHTCIYNTLVL